MYTASRIRMRNLRACMGRKVIVLLQLMTSHTCSQAELHVQSIAMHAYYAQACLILHSFYLIQHV